MSFQLQFERVNNLSEQTEIERAIGEALGNSDEEWRLTVVGFVSTPSYVIDVFGPGIRWGEFYPVGPRLLEHIKRDIERLARFFKTQSISGYSFQARPNSSERTRWMKRDGTRSAEL